MKKIGFTLAEVLVTLSIIGVVAALTVPNLVTSNRNQVNATRLASTVGILENAFSNMMVQEGVDSLFDTQAWRNDNNPALFAGNLGRYLKHNGYLENYDAVANLYGANLVQRLDGSDSQMGCWEGINCGTDKRSHQYIMLKNGALVAIHTLPSDDSNADAIRNDGGRLTNEAAGVMIDVNGPGEGPNIWGRDNFIFYLGHDGALYAAASRESYIYERRNPADGWWGDSCDPNANAAIGYVCTNTVIENGYRMNY